MFGQPFAQVRPWRDAGDPHLAHVSLHPLAIDRCEALLQQHGQLPRAIKRVRCVEFVDAVLDRHFLRRWRHRLIVQTPSADTEQIGLRAEWERVGVMLDQRAPLGMTQDGSFFFRKLTWVVRRPISAYRSSSWRSYVALTSVNESRRSNTSGRPLMAACFQSRRTVACTPYSDVSWLSVLVSFSSSRTTWALKVAV